MHLSTHYYVISLSEHSNVLYEAFRDVVIDIRNGGFPVEVSSREQRAADSIDRQERLHEALQLVDQNFGNCYQHDPLKVVVTGDKEMQDLFLSVTVHRKVILGCVEGDFSTSSLHDLGKIVWSVVKDAISGVLEEATRELDIAVKAGRAACGLDVVSHLAISGVRATLIVEDDYHVRGSLTTTGQSFEISQDVNVMDEIDDAIDMVIDKVLESDGNVVFAPNGSLHKYGRIALFPRVSEGS